jgi:GTP-binding protein
MLLTHTHILLPGLIEGAHEDRGLGHDFLRHIERTKILLFVVDGAASENRLPHNDFRSLVKEIGLYDRSLLKKPAFIFANKIDIECDDRNFVMLEKEAKLHSMKVLYGSAQKGSGMREVAIEMRNIIENGKSPVYGRKKK